MKTPLYSKHEELKARLVDFHGWEMPIQYTSIIDEHHTVRNDVGIFDVSHMGEILIDGKDGIIQLQGLCTNDILSIDIGKSIYTHILDENGAIIDDTIIFRIQEWQYLIMPNAASISKVLAWIKEKISFEISDLSDKYSCLAIQGPRNMAVLEKIFGNTISTIKRFRFIFYPLNVSDDGNTTIGSEIMGSTNSSETIDSINSPPHTNPTNSSPSTGIIDFDSKDMVMISKTGYTGEEGLELIMKNEYVCELWDMIMKAGEEHQIKPIGLGARDTLRLEMGYLLSGQDFDGSQTPLESNCSWVVKWNHDFIGKEALHRQKEEKTHDLLVGIMLDGKAAARPGTTVHFAGFPVIQSPQEIEGSPPPSGTVASLSESLSGEDETSMINTTNAIGLVTSGNFSPTLEKAIALARVKHQFAKPGTRLILKYRNRELSGEVVKLPFIKIQGK